MTDTNTPAIVVELLTDAVVRDILSAKDVASGRARIKKAIECAALAAQPTPNAEQPRDDVRECEDAWLAYNGPAIEKSAFVAGYRAAALATTTQPDTDSEPSGLADEFQTEWEKWNRDRIDDSDLVWWITDNRNAILTALRTDRKAVLEEAARLVERRIDQRFDEHGTREPDTNAGYYGGAAAEIYESLDEEDEAIAQAIRALADKGDA